MYWLYCLFENACYWEKQVHRSRVASVALQEDFAVSVALMRPQLTTADGFACVCGRKVQFSPQAWRFAGQHSTSCDIRSLSDLMDQVL